MRRYKYRDSITYRERNAKEKFSDSNTFLVDLQPGVTATFALDKIENCQRKMKLIEIEFDRERFTPGEARKYYRQKEVYFYDTRFSLKTRVPVAERLINLGNKKYIAVSSKKSGKKEVLANQIRTARVF